MCIVWHNLCLHNPTIINMRFIYIFSKIFEPYAKFWLNPLMELILQMKDKEQPGTEGINYFIVDLVVTMLSWSTTAIPGVSWRCLQIERIRFKQVI